MPAALALLYLLLLTVPCKFQALHPPLLDDCWCYALNMLTPSGYTFGQDVVFTYGPLGYLLEPRNLFSSMTDSSLVFISIMAVWAATLTAYLIAADRKQQFFVFVLCFSVVYSLQLSVDYHLLIIILLLCYLPFRLNRPTTLAGSVAGLLAGMLTMMKFNLGLSALLSVFLAAACWRLEFKAKATRSIVATIGSFAFTFLLLSAAYFKSADNLFAWIRGSVEIASGYSATMGLIDPDSSLAAALSLMIIFAAATSILLLKRSPAGYPFLIALPGILLAYKHSFVRQDAHQAFLFTFMAGVLSAVGLASRNQKSSALTYCSVPVVILLGLKAILMSGQTEADLLYNLSASPGLLKLNRLMHINQLKAELDRQTERSASECRLPATILQRIKQAGDAPVGTLPNCIGYCPANGLRWSPLPVLQLYSAYTPYLDKLCAVHFEKEDAPKFVIFGSNRYLDVDLGEIDHRHPLLEAPLTTLALLEKYQLAESQAQSNVILLERKAATAHATFTDLNTTQQRLEEWLPVPGSDRPLLACIKLTATPGGALLPPLYQLPPVELEVAFPEGNRSWRMTPANLKSGLLINRLPRNYCELATVFSGENPSHVQAVRLTGPGCKLFKKAFEIKWVKVSFDQPENGRLQGSTATGPAPLSGETSSYSCK